MRIVAIFMWFFLLVGQTTSVSADFSDDFRAYILADEAPGHRSNTVAASIDFSAQSCLTCHDGSHASPITVRRRGSPLQIRGSQTLNHPIGMNYDESARHDPQGYRARSSLHPNIQLVDGQVTCVSCHQVRTTTLASTSYNVNATARVNGCTATKELTTGYGDRALCLACHIK